MLKNEDYFACFNAHMDECKSPRIAWVRTEKEFFKLYGMKRFLSLKALRDHYYRIYRRGKCRRIVLHIVEEIKMK